MKLEYRKAETGDISTLVHMLADDELGATREDTSEPLNPSYVDVFHEIERDANNELTVVECEGALVGMLQLTFIPYLTHTGSWRCLIEGVRIASGQRGKGLGTEMFRWAIARAKARGCSIVQLTSDKQRPEALRFYESLGFAATHEGFKLKVTDSKPTR